MKSPEKAAFEIILIITTVLALFLVPLAAKACLQSPPGPPPFSEVDTDGDGFLSEEEFESMHADRMAAMAEAGKPMKGAASAPVFAEIDTDGDGKLSESELTAAHQAHRKAMRQSYGGKGKNRPRFGDIDTNGDGCIDADEFAEHQASHHRRHQGQHE